MEKSSLHASSMAYFQKMAILMPMVHEFDMRKENFLQIG